MVADAEAVIVRLLTAPFIGSTICAMDIDELFPSKPGDPLTEVTRQDLGPLSVDELAARIDILKGEIARVEAHIEAVSKHRSAAEELFRK